MNNVYLLMKKNYAKTKSKQTLKYKKLQALIKNKIKKSENLI